MSTRDDPKKISDRSVRYKRRVDKKEDQLDDPSEQDQKKGKGKGKKQVPLLPVVAPPQTRRPAESPPTHEAYVREKLASTPINAYLQPLEELTTSLTQPRHDFSPHRISRYLVIPDPFIRCWSCRMIQKDECKRWCITLKGDLRVHLHHPFGLRPCLETRIP